MRRLFAVVLVVCAASATPARADVCAQGGAATVFSCAIEGSSRVVHVCRHDGDVFRYTYGEPGRTPDLTLRRRPADLTYIPWSGAGRAVWAALGIPNGAYLYEVSFTYDRIDEIETGTLIVYRAGTVLAEKRCRADTLRQDLMGLDTVF